MYAATTTMTGLFAAWRHSILPGVLLCILLCCGLSLPRSVVAAARTPPPVPAAAVRDILRTAADAYNKNDYTTTLTLLTPLADKGDAYAAFILGLMAMRGHGMPISAQKAQVWWLASARAGHPEAQFQLGRLYFQGLLGARDSKAAREWWTRAADGGHGDAIYGLGQMDLAGDGVARNPGEAARRFARAADLGHPAGMYHLALLYRQGLGVSKDVAKGDAWMRKAAEAGYEPAREAMRH